jgi:predicted RNA-binding Zn ribbon-like protein
MTHAGNIEGRGRSLQLVKCLLMETAVDTRSGRTAARELAVVGGNLALDLANTVDDPAGPLHYDHIATYPELLAWSQRLGVLTDGVGSPLAALAGQHPRRANASLKRAAALRSAIQETVGAVVDGQPVDPGWERLRPFVAAALRHAELGRGGSDLRPTWEFRELDSPLWPVAEAAYGLLVGPELRRVRRCAACPWLFVDRSKNGSRRWCTMEVCGTEEKIRRYVQKRAARRRGSPVTAD